MADSPAPVTNLPAQLSSFIGRKAELVAVRRLVTGARLVTLTGAGGVGKTRLALQAAAGLADGTGDGVWFADLAPLRDPELVWVTVADVLGVRLTPDRPVAETVVEAVGVRRLLLVLDNCEQLIGTCAKAGGCAAARVPEPGAARDQPRAAWHRRGAGVPGAVAGAPGRR